MRLTYANVMATVAVFIALGGTGVAAVSLTKNSVRSKHIKDGQVKTRDLGRNAVRTAKVKNGALLAEDFAPGQLPAGAKGDKGDTGAVGPTFGGTSGPTPPVLQGASAVSVLSTQIDLPKSGDLLIFARNEPTTGACTGNPCTIHMGLYLDGQPVPGSDLTYGPSLNASVPSPAPDLFGRMPSVSAGQHEIAVYFVNAGAGGASGGGAGQRAALGWVLLGG
jgi:hypothetical protein